MNCTSRAQWSHRRSDAATASLTLGQFGPDAGGTTGSQPGVTLDSQIERPGIESCRPRQQLCLFGLKVLSGGVNSRGWGLEVRGWGNGE